MQCYKTKLFRSKLILTQNKKKYKCAVVYKIVITAGLTSICDVAALWQPMDNIQNLANSPDCLLGVVTQPTDSRLSKTSSGHVYHSVHRICVLHSHALNNVLVTAGSSVLLDKKYKAYFLYIACLFSDTCIFISAVLLLYEM